MNSGRRQQHRWRNRAAIAIALVGIGYGWNRYQENVRIPTVTENTKRAEKLIAEIDKRLPLGTTQHDVLAFLHTEHPSYSTSSDTEWPDYSVAVADEPSNVWYCGSWTVYVTLRYEKGLLVKSSITRWSNNCL
jgi:hypothetical protein